ncbi:guanylate kinase [Gammaproteobacteria bacterium]|jgi:guanylate kinase|nr:guanylate kinase [Gammaproteobacteria bacterium]MDA8720058.1 guanylate kinase [bacterium]MDA8925189.1 guanylate kinase [Gammaproteobacteria bacterium]MDA9341256.1 guanylate kinase [Gammaproteobacteria bacterium]MDB4210388.1 guanylate kinase [Gammaproteobacteria bacterium]|tara:strand:+ start:637 stop:1266 length:630 start_codon:yes stop_codon:yes gene_type:complete
MQKSNLFLVSAPSGTGKSTLINSVLDRAKQSHFPLELSISFTTRTPRVGETDSDHYFFISPEEFIAKKESNFFLEYAQVHGNWYGTSVDFVQSKLDEGVSLILEIDVQGFRLIHDLAFDYESIFILPPSIFALEDRIKKRGDSDLSSINLRLENAKNELMCAGEYKNLIINDAFDEASEALYRIITEESTINEQNRQELELFLAKLLSS